MVDSVVFVIETKIVHSSAPNSNFYGNKRTLEALCTIILAIQVKLDDKAVICQVKHMMYVGSFYSCALSSLLLKYFISSFITLIEQ